MSSSSAKIFRKPARNIAWVSATMTRTNWPLLPSPAPKFSSMLTGMVDIQFLALRSFKVILVYNYSDATAASIFEAPHHSPAAIDLHILSPTQYVSGQHDRKIHHGTDGHVVIHREQHS